MTAPVSTGTRYATDLIERVASTYAVAFLGLLVADSTNFTTVGHLLTAGRSAALAALPAAFSLLKGLLAKLVGNGDSASLSPKV